MLEAVHYHFLLEADYVIQVDLHIYEETHLHVSLLRGRPVQVNDKSVVSYYSIYMPNFTCILKLFVIEWNPLIEKCSKRKLFQTYFV